MTSKSLYTSFHQNQSHYENQVLMETLQSVWVCIVHVWSKVGGGFQGAAHIHRGVVHTEGTAHTEGATHTEPPLSAIFQQARRTPTKGQNRAKLPQIFCEAPQIDR